MSSQSSTRRKVALLSFLARFFAEVSPLQLSEDQMEDQLADLLEELKQECPVFGMHGSQVEVLSEPAEFYQFLLDGCRRARRRVVLSSLYLGNGPLSLQLLTALTEALSAGAELELRVLLDCQRGGRGSDSSPSSRRLLAPLVGQFQHRCQVALYHTPTLRGLLRWLLPDRWNEIVGLQHMKVYIFDDDLVISGANLNDDYFTERQDRYMVFRGAAALADFYSELVATVARFSLQLTADDTLHMDPSWPVHPYRGDLRKFTALVRADLRRLLARWRQRAAAPPPPPPPASPGATDTWVLPTVNLGPARVHLDESVSRRLLEGRLLGGQTYLATGYFNLTDANMAALAAGQRPVAVLCAHPTANGFLGAPNLSGYIPAAYTYLLQRCYRALGPDSGVTFHEYRRPGWTFHSKGLWCHPEGEETPAVTVIGSSNFGYRSAYRDLESQVVVVTRHGPLRHALAEERRKLYSHSTPVDDSTFARPDRLVPRWVRLVSRLIRHFF